MATMLRITKNEQDKRKLHDTPISIQMKMIQIMRLGGIMDGQEGQ